ncbi:SOS response-associated peptidase [Arenibacter aquaticus]|uniref:Abasic site processing protein n=1 Tax=Arenibacter aquaticus TaxID=2489054 RepID=A0A430K4F8_9FLAO|nr:SOS response-associated peptidase family protein [Arenibacter aquaticus]RTE53868.1 SOS response-associated peptidase [Arenibacter aquaticus]
MCFGTRVTSTSKEVKKFYNVSKLMGKTPIEGELTYNHANGWAHPLLWIIPQESSSHITPSMWGIIPQDHNGADFKNYYKNAARYGAGLNARSEKLFDHFIYRFSAMSKRCIIPVNGFYEPHTAPKKFKIPFYFERKDKSIISLAGIYTTTKDGYNTFTILTKAATPLFKKIHNTKNRRPVILNDENVQIWLNNDLNQDDIQNMITDDLDDVAIKAYPISKDLYNPKIDSNRADIIEEVHYKELEIEY